jgi:hypothetical protein
MIQGTLRLACGARPGAVYVQGDTSKPGEFAGNGRLREGRASPVRDMCRLQDADVQCVMFAMRVPVGSGRLESHHDGKY